MGILGVVVKQSQPSIVPSNQNPLGALPARFRRERVLVVGCGDVGLRAARELRHARVLALTSSAARRVPLRSAGITEERARMHLAEGHVYANDVRVSDPDAAWAGAKIELRIPPSWD